MRLKKFLLLLLIIAVVIPAYGSSRAMKLTVKMPDGKYQPLYKGSYALVIGNSDYTAGWPDLPGVKKDVNLVRQALEKKGFTVIMKRDLNRQQMIQAFDDFINKYGHQVNNRLIFYFAGHGHTMKLAYGDDMGYVIPVDAPVPSRDKTGFVSKALDMQQIEVYAKRIQAKHAMFLFDSCFSGSIFALSRAVPENINYKTVKPVRQFITSGSANETVPDESIFRAQFIAGINGEADANNDGYITGVELGEYLQNSVVNYSKGSQHPQYGKIRNPHLDKGDFVFFHKQQTAKGDNNLVKVAAIAPPPPPVAVAGHLQINVNIPEAKVYLDNEFIGTAKFNKPLNHSNVPTGQYTIKVIADGYGTKEKVANVKLNAWEQLVFQFDKNVDSAKLATKPYSNTIDYYKEPAQSGNMKTVFYETFSNNSNNWELGNWDKVEYKMQYGKFHVNRKVSNNRSHCARISKYFNENGDFDIEVDVAKISGPENWGYGLNFGAKDSSNGFRFELTGNGYYTYGRIDNGKWIADIPWKSHYSVHKNNASNKLKISKRGNTVYLYVNGTQVATQPFKKFYGHKIGLCSNDKVHMTGDNLTIRTGGTSYSNSYANKNYGNQKVVLYETFSNNSNKWSIGNWDKVEYKLQYGKYHVNRKVSNKMSHCSRIEKYFNDKGDFEIETDIEKISGPNNWGYGINFGAKDGSNGFRYELTGNGYYTFGRIHNGKWIADIPWKQNSAVRKDNARNKLKIVKKGNTLYLYVNGSQVATQSFRGFYGYKIGLCANDKVHMAADNLIIRAGSSSYSNNVSNSYGGDLKSFFTETFSNNNRGWVVRSDDLISYSVKYGKYYIDRKVSNGKSHCTWVPSKMRSSGNWEIETALEKISGDSNKAMGIYFGAKDINNGYQFDIADTGYVRFMRYENGKSTVYIPWKTNSAVRKGSSKNILKIAKRGNTLYFYVNGTQVATQPYRNFYGTKIGYCLKDRQLIAADYLYIKQ